MKIQRLLGILCVLANADKITIQELAQRFEVSKRTIFRDLDTLNCAGIPIVTYPGIGGGVSIIEGYKIDNRVLSADDTEKVFTALNGLKSIDGDTAITNLIAKLNLFSDKCKEGMFQVILEYDISAEFGLTDKIDACFFEKNVNSETPLREIRFFASDLLWTADFVMGIIDKVRVVSPPELYEEVKRRINKINSYYKG